MVALDVVISCVLFGVRLIVLTEGVKVIADGSGDEVLTTDSPFVSLIVELLFTTFVLLMVTKLDVMGITFADGFGDTFVDFVGVIGVTEVPALLLTVVLEVFEVVGVDDILIVALLRSLFAKRLFISVEVLVVGTARVVDEVD